MTFFPAFFRASAWYRIVLSVSMIAILLDASPMGAQQPSAQNNRTSKGKDFWITYMPNFHEVSTSRPSNSDSLSIYITCDVPTQGSITYRNRSGQTFTTGFQIANPNQVYSFGIPFRGFELESFNDNQNQNINYQSEVVAQQSFHVTAANDVTVYGLNQGFFTSDAFLALPTTSLGRDYMIMSYNSDGDGTRFNQMRPGNSTPSEFAIVATEDNTDVRIVPTAPTFRSRTANPITVRLNRGESYLVLADVTVQNGTADLTGSRVTATKPIGVFGGHQRAVIPFELKGPGRLELSTRDHLVEQLPGLETWGKSAFLTPYSRPTTGELGVGTDIYRILAAYDSTKVSINGSEVATLKAGTFYEGKLTEPSWVTSANQILVAQYKKTSSSQENQFDGDPFMMIIPTREQYDTSYRFINMQAFDNDLVNFGVPSRQVFTEHFVTVVIPTTAANTVRLDGNFVGANRFQPIVNSGVSFANIGVSGGVHTAKADSAFAIYVYGYGVLNSYGYIGGGQLRVIAPDRDAPRIIGRDTCFGFNGVVYDTLLTDSRIRSVEFQQTTLGNVTVQRDQFTPYADSVRFRVRLNNIYQDGSTTVVAQDSIGFVARRTIVVPGLTVGGEGQGNTGQPVVGNVTIETGRSRIFPITLTNFGVTTEATYITLEQSGGQGIGDARFYGDVRGNFISYSDPIRIATTSIVSLEKRLLLVALSPGQSTTANIQYDAFANGSVTIRLFSQTTASIQLLNSVIQSQVLCGTRDLTLLTITSGKDTTKPIVATTLNPCPTGDGKSLRTVSLVVQDPEPFPSGIRSVILGDNFVNCTLVLEPIINSLLVRGTLIIQNSRLDAIYSLRVVDSAGNERVLTDTIQGFTLQLVNTTRDTVGAFGAQAIASLVCTTLQYRNIGVKPFVIERWAPRGNVYFSLPVGQFPATIPRGGTRSFQVCFSPLEAKNYLDTLLVEQFCVQESILLSGMGIPLVRTENTRCNAEVRLTTSSAPLQYFMEQNFPNPASDFTTITIGVVEPMHATLTLYNALGMPIATLADALFPAGVVDVQLNVSQLESGLYFYELRSLNNVTKHVVKQLYVIR